jgi:hypothetical protein
LPGGEAEEGPLAGALSLSRWRAYRLDLLAMLVIFAGASLAAGRIWRFPFDDEIQTLAPNLPPAFRGSLWGLVRFYLEGGDIHPPLSFAYFTTLHGWGIGEPALRLGSLAMTAIALALWQWLALALIGAGDGTAPGTTARLIAVLLFGLCPMAIGLGDAIRWYPQFTLCVAAFAALYLAARTAKARLCSAIPLGLAASINLIAPLVVLPFAIYRYFLERAWRRSFDLAYWALFAIAASPGLYTAVSVARRRLPRIWTDKFADNPATAAAADVLGVFGGNTVGVGEAWLIVPAVAIAVFAVAAQIDWRRPANPIHLPLLLLGGAAPAVLTGFSESRSFLYLAPVVAAVVTVFLARGASGKTVLLACSAIVPGLVAIGAPQLGDHPFKRTLAVPYGDIIDFVESNKAGDTLLLSTDPIVPWELGRHTDPGLCVSYFFDQRACFDPARSYGSVLILSGYSNRSANQPAMQRFAARVAEMTAGREKIAELRVGHDEDAALKTWLTGVPLDRFILTVDLYR